MIEIEEEKQPQLYSLCKLLYGFYASIYEVKAGDRKTHWNLCYFTVALLISPLYWALKQLRSVLMLYLVSCVLLYFTIRDSKGSIKSFVVDFAESIKGIIDDSGNSYGDPIHPGKAITYLWIIASIGSLGYLCYQYPRSMLISTAVLIAAISLVGISNALDRKLAKARQIVNDRYARASKKVSRIYYGICPCVKIIPAESSND